MRPLSDLISRIAPILHSAVLPYAIMFGLVLACVALSLAALLRAAGLSALVLQRAAADRKEWEAGLESMRRELNALAGQIREAATSSPALSPAAPRSGWNLSNRSQALRMHRRGAAPVEIAATLRIPLQEVDLLLKVHRIIIRNI